MKIKKEYFILVLVIVALSAYLFMRTQDQTHYDLPELAIVDSDQINRMLITKGDRKIELKKKDGEWSVGPASYMADSIKARNMVRTAADLALTALVSESESYERYGLGNPQKIMVEAFNGKDKVRDFAIGRQAPTLQHTFVAVSGNTKIFHARGNLEATYDYTVDELRDKTVLKYEKSEINSLTLTRGDTIAAFTRSEIAPDTTVSEEDDQQQQGNKPTFKWVDPDGNDVKTVDIDRLIARFSNLKCNTYLDDTASETLKEPLWKVELKSDPKTHYLALYAKENEESIEFPAGSSGSPYAFTLNKSRVDMLEKALSGLLQPDVDQSKP